MTTPQPTPDPRQQDAELDRLVVEALDRIEAEGSQALDAICSAHAGQAERLRAAVQVLLDHGLVAPSAPEAPPPPRALGDLRSTLPPHAKALVTKELDKDLVHLPEQDLEKHLLDADAIL